MPLWHNHRMVQNPCLSPETDPCAASTQRSKLRVLFSFVNFIVSVLLIVSCVIAIGTMERPGSFFGGVLAFLPVLVYGICEWLVLYRRNASVERKLAYVNLVSAAFLAFGMAKSIGEAVTSETGGNLAFAFGFSLIFGLIVAYLLACGWCRLRWTRRADLQSK